MGTGIGAGIGGASGAGIGLMTGNPAAAASGAAAVGRAGGQAGKEFVRKYIRSGLRGVSKIVNAKSKNKGSEPLKSYYDPESNVIEVLDPRDRIVGDSIDQNESFLFAYDLNDNRQSKAQAAGIQQLLSYAPASNRVSFIDTVQQK